MAAKKTVVANATDRIAELVEKRDHLAELKGLTEQAPRSFEEAEADIPRVVEMLVSRCEPQLAWVAQSASGYADLARQLGQQDPDYGPISAASLMAWAAPDVLAVSLRRDLEQAYRELPKPMPGAARHAELSRLQTELGAVEVDLASTWGSVTEAGMTLDLPAGLSGAVLIGLAP